MKGQGGPVVRRVVAAPTSVRVVQVLAPVVPLLVLPTPPRPIFRCAASSRRDTLSRRASVVPTVGGPTGARRVYASVPAHPTPSDLGLPSLPVHEDWSRSPPPVDPPVLSSTGVSGTFRPKDPLVTVLVDSGVTEGVCMGTGTGVGASSSFYCRPGEKRRVTTKTGSFASCSCTSDSRSRNSRSRPSRRDGPSSSCTTPHSWWPGPQTSHPASTLVSFRRNLGSDPRRPQSDTVRVRC